jgi:hypothetical protein
MREAEDCLDTKKCDGQTGTEKPAREVRQHPESDTGTTTVVRPRPAVQKPDRAQPGDEQPPSLGFDRANSLSLLLRTKAAKVRFGLITLNNLLEPDKED